MLEKTTDNEPFLCLEVNKLEDFTELSKKFDILFPNRIIRLVHEGNYTPYFYLGNDRWEFKPPISSTVNLSFRLMPNEYAFDRHSFNESFELDLLFGPASVLLKTIAKATLNNKEYDGIFLSNGNFHFFSQRLMPDMKSFIEDIIHFLDAKIAFDLLNEVGVIALETKQNILGKND